MDVSVRRSGQSTVTTTLILIGCSVLFFCIGFGAGFAVRGPEGAPTESAPADAAPPKPAPETSKAATPPADPAMEQLESLEQVWPARHLFVAVAGTSVDEQTKTMLASMKPGGVVLTAQNIQGTPQAQALVQEIKSAVGLGNRIHDLPLIAAAQEGGVVNTLNLGTAPGAREIAGRRDLELAKEVGKTYADACTNLGVGVMLAPVLDIYAPGAPARMESRTFGNDENTVTAMGLWFASGVIEGGVIPVAKHYPGMGGVNATARNPLPVLNQDVSGLAVIMLPFGKAGDMKIPGILAGHVSVPAIDKSDPPRPASLSPTMINTVLRDRWDYNGVILADDIASETVTQLYSLPDAAVEALASGCDAVIVTATDPAVLQAICDRIESAVQGGELASSALRDSKKRLDNWQAWLRSPAPLKGTLPTALPEPGSTPEPPQPAEADTAETPEPMPAGPESEIIYTVQPGDVLSRIAAKYDGVSTNDIIEWNDLRNATIRVGQELKIRVRGEAPAEPEPQVEEPAPEPEPEPMESEPKTVEPEVTEAEPDAPEPAMTPTEYVVQSGDVLSRIAAKFGVTTQQLMDWNDLDNSRISVGQTLMVGAPMESEAEAPAPTPEPAPEEEAPAPEAPAEETDTAEPEPEPEPADAGVIEYTVKSGDILSRIASDHDVTVQQLMDWNNLENSRLSIGQKLMIGGSAEPGAEASAPDPAPEEAEPEDVEPEPAPAEPVETEPETVEPEPAAPETMTEYVVQSGDVLSRIATKFGVTTRQIMDWNGLENTRIRIGQTLKIAPGEAADMPAPDESAEPEPEPEPEPAEPESAEVTQTKHSVQIGETLSGIAAQYGVTMADLISWNDLDPDGKLQAGRVLTIYGGSSGGESEPAPEAEAEDAFGEYVIQSGDSPLSIAQQFGISPEELMEMNGVTDVNTLRVGQTLRVPKIDE